SFDIFCYEVSERRAIWRIISRVEGIALKTFIRFSQRMPLDVHQCILYRKYSYCLLHRVRLELPQGRDVIERIKTATESGQHEIAFALLNHHVAHRNGGQAAF